MRSIFETQGARHATSGFGRQEETLQKALLSALRAGGPIWWPSPAIFFGACCDVQVGNMQVVPPVLFFVLLQRILGGRPVCQAVYAMQPESSCFRQEVAPHSFTWASRAREIHG